MPDPIFIPELIGNIIQGHIRIPSFQRGFVWDAEQVAHLMDSIYKGYPFGSLLFWRTKTPLQSEWNLGPFELPKNDPEYPIDYILDGQQRATSIFGVFQSQLVPAEGKDDSWSKIYFELHGNNSAQDSQFLYVPDKEVDLARHFPLKILFNPPKYLAYLKDMDSSIMEKVAELHSRFNTAKIPVQSFATNDRTVVAIVFERINRLGVELDTLQLLSAWSWSEDFDLQEEFSELKAELSPYGFNDVGEDSDLLLRCCAAIMTNDASHSSLINLKGTDVRTRFQEVRSGVLGAVDFLKTHVKAYSAKILPQPQILVPLSVFFATDQDQSTHPNAAQHKKLVEWIWRAFFTRRYNKRLEQLNQDIKEIVKLKRNEANALGDFSCEVEAPFFLDNDFSLRNVNTKTFVLMLASEAPLDFIGGGEVPLNPVLRECNKKEFHHIYPKAYLEKKGGDLAKFPNILANFCIIPRASNNQISNRPPSEYRTLMPGDAAQVDLIMSRALCPLDIFHDDYARFLKERTPILVQKAQQLMGILPAQESAS